MLMNHEINSIENLLYSIDIKTFWDKKRLLDSLKNINTWVSYAWHPLIVNRIVQELYIPKAPWLAISFLQAQIKNHPQYNHDYHAIIDVLKLDMTIDYCIDWVSDKISTMRYHNDPEMEIFIEYIEKNQLLELITYLISQWESIPHDKLYDYLLSSYYDDRQTRWVLRDYLKKYYLSLQSLSTMHYILYQVWGKCDKNLSSCLEEQVKVIAKKNENIESIYDMCVQLLLLKSSPNNVRRMFGIYKWEWWKKRRSDIETESKKLNFR